ncbi:MAG: hypothetical protein II324_00700, partial [Selenomonadales bacterium]|nr:hypothetical protein [Selenomonadales bacterium]
MLDFSFVGIAYGWLMMKIQTENHYAVLQCDECLDDPLPGMMHMYNALKEGKDFSWRVDRGWE